MEPYCPDEHFLPNQHYVLSEVAPPKGYAVLTTDIEFYVDEFVNVYDGDKDLKPILDLLN